MHTAPRAYLTTACVVVVATLLLLVGCRQQHTATPLPIGYMRIATPAPTYQRIDSLNGYSFERSHLAEVIIHGENINLSYPLYQATLYGTHITSHSRERLYTLLHQAQQLTFQQGGNGATIEAIAYEADNAPIYATLYRVKGDRVASPLQFVITDSVASLFRGALYFDQTAVTDSLAPVVEYLQTDIMHLIETFNWNSHALTR